MKNNFKILILFLVTAGFIAGCSPSSENMTDNNGSNSADAAHPKPQYPLSVNRSSN
ncbi:MAG: hypothetical protein ACXVAX_03760 [Pseudobdellovibrio sp.]